MNPIYDHTPYYFKEQDLIRYVEGEQPGTKKLTKFRHRTLYIREVRAEVSLHINRVLVNHVGTFIGVEYAVDTAQQYAAKLAIQDCKGVEVRVSATVADTPMMLVTRNDLGLAKYYCDSIKDQWWHWEEGAIERLKLYWSDWGAYHAQFGGNDPAERLRATAVFQDLVWCSARSDEENAERIRAFEGHVPLPPDADRTLPEVE